MRAVSQLVSSASVHVGEREVGQIDYGLCIFLGVGKADTVYTAHILAERLVKLRIFPDENKRMNRSLLDLNPPGQALVISQFTLYADTSKGSRPSFLAAGDPQSAKELYLEFIAALRESGITVATGEFAAKMEVSLVNQGPVTIITDD